LSEFVPSVPRVHGHTTNSLPAHIRSSDSLVTFQSRLKSHLFSSAYHV